MDAHTLICSADLSAVYPTCQTSRHECVPLRRRAVYGKLNYISVSGIVRLDASVAPQPIVERDNMPTFDVWPTPQAKAAASVGAVRRLMREDYSDSGEEEDYTGY